MMNGCNTNGDIIRTYIIDDYGDNFPFSCSTGTMWHIPSGTTIGVCPNHQYFIYGDMLIEGELQLSGNSQLVVLNGNIYLSGGTITGTGNAYNIFLPLTDTKISNLTYSGNVLTIYQTDGSTFSVTINSSTPFTGNTSGDCITDLYVSNLNSCSPLHIQNISSGDVLIGENGGVNVGIGNPNPTSKLDVIGDLSISGTSILNGILNVIGSTSPQYVTLFKGVNGTGSNFAIGVGDETFGVANDILNSGLTAYNKYNLTASEINLNIVGNNNVPQALSIDSNGDTTINQNLTINDKTKTTNFQMTSGATNGYVLTSDVSGNAYWSVPFSGSSVDTYVTGFTYDSSNVLTISQNQGQPDLTVTLPPYITGFTDYYVTGGTYSNGTLTLERQDSSFTISGFLTGTTTDTYVTGFTYLNNNLTISQNQGQPDLIVNIDVMSGLTINGSLSATTYLGLPIDPDNYVTGGTYSNGTLTLDRQNGSLTITGFTTTFTGNTSGDCITDLFVSNVNSCSPLHIQPINNGNVLIGENGGVNVGIGTSTPLYKLHVSGETSNTELRYIDSTLFPRFNITTNNGDDLTFSQVSDSTSNSSVSLVFRGYSEASSNSYGKQGDGILYASTNVNGLNIINNQNAVRENYIRLYAGGNPSNKTSDIHIQGSGTTNGNVGINNNSPSAKLHIIGQDVSSSNFGLKVQDSGGTNNLVVRNDGNVGINTSNPSYQLEVLPKDLTGTTQVVIRNTSTSPNWSPVSLSVIDGSNYGVTMSNSTNGVDTTLNINSGTYSYLNHQVNGNIVASLLTAGDFLLWRLPDNFNFRRRATNGDWINFNSLNQRVSIFNENIGGVTIPSRLGLRGDTNTSSTYSLVIQNSGGTNTLVVRDDGNVGIGTSSPSEKLEVSGKTKTETLQVTSGATNGYILTSDSNGNAIWSPPSSLTGLSTTDYYVTGGTYSSGTLTLNRQNGSVTISGFLTGATDTLITGFTYSNNNLTINQNQGQSPLSVNISTMTGLTINGNLSTTSISPIDYINFNVNPTIPSATGGTLYFDYNENALSYKPITNQNDVTVNIGQESLIRIYNQTGAQINNGQVLHITGATGGIPTVALANASKLGLTFTDSLAQSSGVATHNIPNGEYGFMTNFGIVRDLNTSGFTVGQELFLSDTIDGGITDDPNSIAYTSRISTIGWCLTSDATTGKIYVKIENENPLQSLTQQEINVLLGNTISTGAYTYTGMTKASSTTVNVSPMRGWIVYNTYEYSTNPLVLNIYYSGGTNIPVTSINSSLDTYFLVNSGGTLYQQTTFPTPEERRNNIFLGRAVHPNKTSILNVEQSVDYDVSPMSALRDLWAPIKLINQGVIPSNNGTNLEFKTSSGIFWGNGIGWDINELDPNSITVPAYSPAVFYYTTQTGGSFTVTANTIDTTNYDVNGIITNIPGSGNYSTQRIYMSQSGVIRVQYAQNYYSTLAKAIAAIPSETFIENSDNGTDCILIGLLTVKDGTGDLSNTDDAIFTLVSKFGEILGGTAGISTTTLQQAYNNSVNPEITTNVTLGGVQFKGGTGSNTDKNIIIENNSGVETAYITAGGYGVFNSLSATTISGGTYYGDGSNLTNIVTSITATSGLSGNSMTGNVTIINTSPDQVVTLSGGTGVSVTGTYPNFTIINTLPEINNTNTINLFNYYNFI